MYFTSTTFSFNTPVRARGLSRECVLSIPSVIVKGELMGRCVGNHRIERVVPCRC